jgi:hypothetical protein
MSVNGAVIRDFAERMIRQLSQVALPILVAAAASPTGGWRIDWVTFTSAAIVTMTVTAAKVSIAVLADWETTTWWKDLVDRSASAGLTTFVGFFPISVVQPGAVDWRLVSYMSALSALIAVAQFFTSPPTYSTGRHVA